jgi:NAD(P)-dependent dehydrogenase (short-subunit alcohol dehydrogenase family)
MVAVVTGAASGIGFALAEAFARAGLSVVLADVEEEALRAATIRVADVGVETLPVVTDVSVEADVQALARAAVDRFGGIDVAVNNAGVSAQTDAWFGPLEAWEWVLGVNLWGVVHGIRAFLPVMLGGGRGGHIVNTASMAGLMPGFVPSYDASKHAVVAITEDLYHHMQLAGLPIGVSVLCPGWVRTGIVDADRNWPDRLGARPPTTQAYAVIEPHVRRAVDEATPPARIADLTVEAVREDRFWVLPDDEFLELATRRFHDIAERRNPSRAAMPGMPPADQIAREVRTALGLE